MEIISRINWVDVLVAILMIRISYVAFRDGLSHEIFPFLGSIIIVVLSFRYYKPIGEYISNNLVNVPVEISNFLSYLALVIVMGLLLRLLRVILDKIVKVEWHPLIEKFGGLALGVARAYIITGIVLTVLILMPLSYMQWSIRDKSITGKYILMAGPEIYNKVTGASVKKDLILKDLMSDKSIVKKSPADKPS